MAETKAELLLDPKITFDLYGYVKIESRLRPEGNRLIGECRSRHYDRNNLLVEDTSWQPTGITLTLLAFA